MSKKIASLKNVMLLIKDVPKSVKFYSEGLGMTVNHSTEHWAELQSGHMKVCLNKVEGEASSTTGYSPFLCFDVNEMDKTIYKLLEMGAILDGPIKYPSHGKVAALRSPDGHMIGLFEENQSN
ncbi:predicted protein [Naegleria gruberi]|uniref:Predicted protein n=1 Tax=Naegleria gruberi TaxID=5762 RepID=D2UXX0_NAEGR|nr:uncharacterized protein NAEGRDRAFT_29304 [Naegleria gruberi]EFC50700.1 predicted protein [Naegleria gruberi]|eukprot:XP_002683444.1 predicted protein [Naegleria gruberi strain NEG-M]